MLRIKSIEPYTKLVGAPYRWCQILCGLFYENKQDRQELIYPASQGLEHVPIDQSDMNNGLSKQPIDASESSMKKQTNGKEQAGQPDNEIDEEDELMNPLENQQHLSETKLFERIINRLKSRFKARICLQEIINQLSKILGYFLHIN